MSSIKVTIAQTDGSYFISSANNDLPTNVSFNPERTQFSWGGQNYAIDNYRVDPNESLVNWVAGIDIAYGYISLFPNETGYPDLNANAAPYLALDGQKSMARIIEKLTLSDTAVADFSLIYSWSVGGASLSTDEFKAFSEQLEEAAAEAQDEGEQRQTECVAEITAGNTYTWPAVTDASGNIVFESVTCDSASCCEETKDAYVLAKTQVGQVSLYASIGVSAETITKKHIYKFADSGAS